MCSLKEVKYFWRGKIHKNSRWVVKILLSVEGMRSVSHDPILKQDYQMKIISAALHSIPFGKRATLLQERAGS